MCKIPMQSLTNNNKEKSYIYHPDEETAPEQYKLALSDFLIIFFILKNQVYRKIANSTINFCILFK